MTPKEREFCENVSAETVEKYISEQKSRQVVKDATTRVAVSR